MAEVLLDENGEPVKPASSKREVLLDEQGNPAGPKAPPKLAAPEVSPLDQPIPAWAGATGGIGASSITGLLNTLGVTPRGVMHSLPVLGAGAATLATGGAAAPSLLPAMAAAGLGGAGGSFLGQTAEAAAGGEAQPTAGGVLGEAGKEGAIQAAMEPIGAAVGGGINLLGKGLSKIAPPIASAAGRTAEALGLPPAISGVPKYLLEHTWLGSKIAGTAEKAGVDKAAQALTEQAATLGVPPPPPGLSAADLATWTRGALKQSSAAKEAQEAALSEGYKDFTKTQGANYKSAVAQGLSGGKAAIVEAAAAKKSAAAADAALTTSLGKKAADTVRMKLSSDVDQQLLSIGAHVDPEAVGLATRGAVERGSAIGARQAKALYASADSALEGAEIPSSDALRQTLENVHDRMAANPAMRDSVLKDVVDRFLGTPEDGIPGLLDSAAMPFQTVRELQKAVASRMPGFGASDISRDSQGLAKYLWRDLTTAMEEGTAGTPGGEALKIANDYYRGYAGVMKRGFIPKVLKTSPEYVVNLLKDGDVTKPRLLREAVLGYAEKFGTPAEQAEAREAWSTLQANYLRQRLFKGGPEKLAENLDAVGSPVVKELFAVPPAEANPRAVQGGKDFLDGLRAKYGDAGPDGIQIVKDINGRLSDHAVIQRDGGKIVGGGRAFAGERLMVAGGPVVGSPVSAAPVYDALTSLGAKAGDSVTTFGKAAQERYSATSTLGNLQKIGDTLKQLGPRLEKLTADAEARAAGQTAAASAEKSGKLATLKGSVPPPPIFPKLQPPPIPPEVLAAQQQTGLIGQALKQSHAAQPQASGIGGLPLGGAAALGPVAAGMHLFGQGILTKVAPLAGANELLGGMIAKAMYSPARTAELVSALALMGRQGAAGMARLAALEAQWSGKAPAKPAGGKPTYFPSLAPTPPPPVLPPQEIPQ